MAGIIQGAFKPRKRLAPTKPLDGGVLTPPGQPVPKPAVLQPATPTGQPVPRPLIDSSMNKPAALEGGGFGATTPTAPATPPGVPRSTIGEGPGRGPNDSAGPSTSNRPGSNGLDANGNWIPAADQLRLSGEVDAVRTAQGTVDQSRFSAFRTLDPKAIAADPAGYKRMLAEARAAGYTGPDPTTANSTDIPTEVVKSSPVPNTPVTQARTANSVTGPDGRVYADRNSTPRAQTFTNPNYRNQFVKGINDIAARRPDLVGQRVNLLDLPELRDANGRYIGPIDHPEWSTPVGDGFTGQRPDGTFAVNGHQFNGNHENDFRGFFNRAITAPGGERDAPNAPLAPGPNGRPPESGTPTNPIRRNPGIPNTGTAGPIAGDPDGTRRNGTPIPPPTAPGTTNATPTDAATWTPGEGIVDQVMGVDPQTITGVGYKTAELPKQVMATATGYDATGYNADQVNQTAGYTEQGYDAVTGEAETQDENLSQATNRIMADDSELLQQAQAKAAQDANARGLVNTSMGVQAGRAAVLDRAMELGAGDVETGKFNVQQKNAILAQNLQARNKAIEFSATSKNEANKYLAIEKNQNGRFNAEQSNEAKRFTAEATNQAAAFLANAQNTASIFNAGEANKRAMFSVEQANLASKYAADMENAANEFNATAFNQAQQRYADAMNAALAAQEDAENLSRRDAAAATNTAREGAANRQTQQNIATQGVASRLQELGLTLGQREQESLRTMGANMFGTFQAGLNSIMQAEMEPESRQNAISNYMSVWAGSGYLPFDINLDAFPPAGNTTPPPGNPPPPRTNPPPPTTTPPGSGLSRGNGPPSVSR